MKTALKNTLKPFCQKLKEYKIHPELLETINLLKILNFPEIANFKET